MQSFWRPGCSSRRCCDHADLGARAVFARTAHRGVTLFPQLLADAGAEVQVEFAGDAGA